MLRLALFCAALCLAACSPATTVTGTPTTAPVTVVTPEGYGPIRIGMTMAEAEAAVGHPLAVDAAVWDVAECATFRITPEDAGIFLAEKGRVTRVTVHTARVSTPEGAHVGQMSDDVKAIYGDRALQVNAKYNPPPAHELFVWTTPGQAGYRFEVDSNGRVGILHAGTKPGIELVEGCA